MLGNLNIALKSVCVQSKLVVNISLHVFQAQRTIWLETQASVAPVSDRLAKKMDRLVKHT